MVTDATGGSEAWSITHVIVGSPQQVAGVPFPDQLGDNSSRHERNVVGVCLDREQHLALVGRPFGRAFEKRILGRLLRPRLLCVQKGSTATGQACRKDVTTAREMSVWLHDGSPWYLRGGHSN